MYGGLLLIPLYLQGRLHQSPADAGLMLLMMGLGSAVVLPLAGRLTDRHRAQGGQSRVAGIRSPPTPDRHHSAAATTSLRKSSITVFHQSMVSSRFDRLTPKRRFTSNSITGSPSSSI